MGRHLSHPGWRVSFVWQAQLWLGRVARDSGLLQRLVSERRARVGLASLGSLWHLWNRIHGESHAPRYPSPSREMPPALGLLSVGLGTLLPQLQPAPLQAPPRRGLPACSSPPALPCPPCVPLLSSPPRGLFRRPLCLMPFVSS